MLGRSHFGQLQDGCFLLNAGHSPDEIDVDGLGDRTELVPCVEEARLGERSIYPFASGSMANLTEGQGDTLHAFDLTLATMLAQRAGLSLFLRGDDGLRSRCGSASGRCVAAGSGAGCRARF